MGEEESEEEENSSDEENKYPELKYDTLDLRKRTIIETFSPVENFGREAKKDDSEELEEYDTLELRNRSVTEVFSPLSDLGKEAPDEPERKKPRFGMTEILSPVSG